MKNGRPRDGKPPASMQGDCSSAEVHQRMAAVLQTDIVDSINRAAQIGDQRWRDLLERTVTFPAVLSASIGGL